jgi:hypothetical protein
MVVVVVVVVLASAIGQGLLEVCMEGHWWNLVVQRCAYTVKHPATVHAPPHCHVASPVNTSALAHF